MATATNTNDEDFNVGTAEQDANQWSAWTATSGGTMLWRRALANDPAALTANQFYRLPATSLTFTVPTGSQGGTAEAARRAAAGLVAGGVHVQLEQSSDNAALTNRKFIAQSNWTVAA